MPSDIVRRVSLTGCFAVMAAMAVPGAVFAQSDVYPSRQITFVSPGTPGSTSDIMPRVLAEPLAARLGKPVVIENKPGGSGLISANSALAAPADGHTLWMGTMGTLTINPFVLATMPFDSLQAWTPIALVASMPLVLVINPQKTPVNDLAGLIALAKQEPGKVTFGSVGAGSSYAISMFVLGREAGAQFTHVPYRGVNQALNDVLAGELAVMTPDVGLARSQIEGGKLRALAVSSSTRSELLPNVPTFKELGYSIDISLWFGAFVRAGTPQPIVQRLTDDFRVVMGSAEIKARWDALGLKVGDKVGDDFAQYYRSEYKRWGDILRPLGIKAEQ